MVLKAAVLRRECASESLRAVKTDCWAPASRVADSVGAGEAWASALLTTSEVLPAKGHTVRTLS